LKYPFVIDEWETLARIRAGASIGRFGDGEWRCAAGGGCTSQRANSQLAGELKQVLRERSPGFLVGIPKIAGCPRAESWAKYAAPPYSDLLAPNVQYFSSFITRPDNAPLIDKPAYWQLVRELWLDEDIILVVGNAKDGDGPEKKSITSEMMHDAKSIATIIGPRQHAYDSIDSIERQIIEAAKDQNARVLLCIGATATVLAWRLWKRGMHAIDAGHIGMFMRHAGAYRYAADDLLSPGYQQQLQQLHARAQWGADGAKHCAVVRAIIEECKPATALDYGCGEGKLSEGLKPFRVSGYDPGIPEKSKLPKPCDLIICTDVLEHIEPEKIDAVIDHIYRLCGMQAYFVIALRPANAILPDGRNAHLIVRNADWWIAKIRAAGFDPFIADSNGKELRLRAKK
jgi:hypothetical protein